MDHFRRGIPSGPAENLTRCLGESTTFSDRTGQLGGPSSFEWRKDGAPIVPGINFSSATATLEIDSVSRSYYGSYDCVVTGANACAPAVSGIGVLDYTYQSSEVLDFIVRFEDSEPSTDLADEVGQLDFFDVLEFLRRVDAGCP